MIRRLIFSSGLLILTVLVACNLAAEKGDGSLLSATSVYQTIAVQLTETSTSSFRPVIPTGQQPIKASAELTRQTPSLAISTATAQTAIPTTCDRAAAGRPSLDVTVVDGMRIKAGQPFVKTWRLVNTGSCTWTTDYAVIWFSGELFGTSRAQNFRSHVAPGEFVEITVDMVAPQKPGLHQSNWKLRNPKGTLFGIGPTADGPFWVRIDVEEGATPTAAASATVTSTPVVLARGKVQLEIQNSVDLDIGKLTTGASDDLILKRIEQAPAVLQTINGARLAVVGAQTPDSTTCRLAQLNTNEIPLTLLKVDMWLCYRTNMGLPGSARLVSINDHSLTVEFTTWSVP